MKVVANVARYHRRGLPQSTHLPYMMLGREDRVRVQKLGGLLRLANALDAEHLQKVRDLRLDINGPIWVLHVEGTGDLTDGAARRRVTRRHVDRCLRAAADRARRGSRLMAGTRDTRPSPFFNRELSWLAFNARVLEEAADPRNRLLERAKFAAIVASNLDEFFMVRVAALKHAEREGEHRPDPCGLTPIEQLAAIAGRAHAMTEALYASGARRSVSGASRAGDRPDNAWTGSPTSSAPVLTTYFHDEVLPVLTPLAIDVERPFPMLGSLTHQPRVLARARGRTGRAPPGRRAGAGPAVAARPGGGPGGPTFVLLEERHPGVGTGALSRPDGHSKRRPSACRVTPSWTRRTRAPPTSSRCRKNCGDADAVRSCAWRSRRPPATTCSWC